MSRPVATPAGRAVRLDNRVNQQLALERSTALRAVRVDGAPSPPQGGAGLRQQTDVRPMVLDVQAHDLEPRNLRLADQLDVGEQRAIAAQPAPRAQSVCQARLHASTMTNRAAR